MKQKYLILTLVLGLLLVASISGQDRQRQPVPTYTLEIRGAEANDFSVSIEGAYTRPDGKIIEIEKRFSLLPVTLYINADCSFWLKVTSEEKKFRSTLFYEHNETTKKLWQADGAGEIGVRYNVIAYKE